MAHDNSILGYDEALLIFSHVASTVRFIKALEARWVSASIDPSAT